MRDPLEGLTSRQREVATHADGPLLVLGEAGSGKTWALAARHAWLAGAGGLEPGSVLSLTDSVAAAGALRAEVERSVDGGFGELHVHTVHGFCTRLLSDESAEAGLDPFVVVLSPADRLAMLLERVDELTLRLHDFRGDPGALLAQVLGRIDAMKKSLVDVERFAAWAAELPDDDPAAGREREFAEVFRAHDRMLREQGALDHGDLVLLSLELLRRPHVRARVCRRVAHVLVDDAQDLAPGPLQLVLALASEHRGLTAAGDPLSEISTARGAAGTSLLDVADRLPDATTIRLDGSLRAPERVLRAARAVVADQRDATTATEPDAARAGGSVAFWRCTSSRAQAQAAAAEAERLVRAGAEPGRIAVLVRSVRQEGRAVAAALEERAVPYRLSGAAELFDRAEVKDVLAWLRLLVDSGDASAVVRALSRPPVELRSVDVARVVQIARRRKLDMVSALVAATESPQLPPEARERVLAFLKLHRQIAAQLDTRPDLFVHRLIDRLGLRRQQLFSAQADVVERLVSLARLGELAAREARRSPQATGREFARHLPAVAEAGLPDEEAPVEARAAAVEVLAMHAARGREFDHVLALGLQSSRMPGAQRVAADPIPAELRHDDLLGDPRAAHAQAMARLLHVALTRARKSLVLAFVERTDRGARQSPSPFVEQARAALAAPWEERAEELFGPDEALHAAFTELRDELLRDVPRIAGALGELRLDTDLEITHGVVRYLELVKLAAVIGRRDGQPVADTLAQVGAVLSQVTTAQQREVLESSPLDDVIVAAERDAGARAAAIARRAEPSLEAFLPRRGEGLLLSASDIETYRSCPLRYKFARVFRIPSEPTLNQRFGIVVHQVLERYHHAGSGSLDELLGLLDTGWRRSGFGAGDEERQLRAKAEAALRRYVARRAEEDGEPVWLERSFQFRMGPHTLRGRVDRVDRLPDGGYELIDYKTGRPKSREQLRDDVQLSLYALAAREAWDVESRAQSYLYVLDDQKVPVPSDDVDRDWIAETVLEVADGIRAQGFEPTPSPSVCAMCDYRIMCPAAER